jgi:hypothetical protein
MPGAGTARAARLAVVSRENPNGGYRSAVSPDVRLAKVEVRLPVGYPVSPSIAQYRLPDRPPETSGGSRRGDDRELAI